MRWLLIVLAVGFAPLAAWGAESDAPLPVVAQFTTPGCQHNELWLIQGHHFVPGQTQVLHYLVAGDQPDTAQANAWLPEVGKVERLPAVPPEGSRPLEVVEATKETLVVRGVRSGAPLALFWVRTPAGLSGPHLLNRPEPYWVGRSPIMPGEIGMIFGKACTVEFRYGRVALRSRDTGRCRMTELLEVINNRTGGVVPFRIPRDMPPGAYEIWVHNGSGGKWGWGGPLALEVVAPQPSAAVVNARDYGTQGDGLADDTEALQHALDAAAELAARGGPRCRTMVALTPGTYNIQSTITVPAGVLLQGSGAENCLLRGRGYDPDGPRRPNALVAEPAAVVQLVSHAGLRDIAVTGQTAKGTLGATIQVQERAWMEPVVGASIRNCRIVGQDHEVLPSYGMYLRLAPPGGVRCGPQAADLEIYDCKFENCGLRMANVTHRARIVRNDLVTIAVHASIDGYFARNQVHGGIKGFTVSIWPASNYHNLYVLNKISDVASGREGSDGEEFCVHGEGGDKFGRRAAAVTSAQDFALTDQAARWNADAMKFNHVSIVSGRGRGQYRLIVGNTRDTVKIDRPWTVVPDAGSRYLVAGMSVENTYLYNTTHSGNWILLYKGTIASVVEGHETDRSAGIALFTNDGSRRGKPEMETHFSLGWYNEIRNCLLDHTSVKFLFQTQDDNVPRAPTQVGNKVIGCTFRDSLPNHNSFTGSSSMPDRPGLQGAIVFSHERETPDRQGVSPADPLVDGTYTFIEGNSFSRSPVGVAVFDHSDRTFITGNTFWEIGLPLVDHGRGTRFWGNYRQWFDQDGRHRDMLPDVPARKPAAGER